MALVLMPLLLTACDPSGHPTEISLSEIPADLRACVQQVTERPAGAGAMSQREVVALIAKLRGSELRLSGCGRRLIALYDAQAAAIGGN